MSNMNAKKTSGSALITSLFIMTLIAIAATAMTMRLQLDIARTRLTISHDQQEQTLQFAIFWAMKQLKNPKNNWSVSNKEGKVFELPKRLRKIDPAFQLSASIYDLQSRFNINNLIEPKMILALERLLNTIQSKRSKSSHRQLILATHYWIRHYQPEHPEADLMSYYLAQKPPYLPAHQPLKSISELRLIKAVDAKTYEQLLPWVTALPETTPININTAPRPILSTLGYGLTKNQINQVIKFRGKKGLPNSKKLTLLLEPLKIPAEQVTIKSQYFLCKATLTAPNGAQQVRYAMLQRIIDKKGRIKIRLVHDTSNTL